MNNSLSTRTSGILLIVESLILFVPMAILGSAVNWPANLSEPASVNLPMMIEHATAIKVGYFIYLIYSILFFPVILMIAQTISGNSTYSPLLKVAISFAGASTVARTFGITRWLSAMPVLANLYVNGTSETKATTSIIYDAVNSFGGTIGEALGVGLFAGLSVFLICIALLQDSRFPRWVGISGLVTALAITLQSLELFGIDLGALISVLVGILHLWMLGVGIHFLSKPAAYDSAYHLTTQA